MTRAYLAGVAAFAGFVLFVGLLEHLGLGRRWIGVLFLLATVSLYAGIGIVCRTTDALEYYVAGRRIPALYNGMATAADWMSAASFIGLTGTLYLQGYGGLAYVIGWTGGYCLVALLLAPFLRKFGAFTIPDFLGERYGGTLARCIGLGAAILCSFVDLVAQIYGVGLITTQLTGVDFVLGIFLGLGGVLLCSFLGGMRAVTWTQVAQYLVLILAYLVPVVWLAVKQTGNPLPQWVYGQQLARVSERERALMADPREIEAAALFKARADGLARKLADVPAALAAERSATQQRAQALRLAGAPLAEQQAADRAIVAVPRSEAAAREAWSRSRAVDELRSRPLGGMPPHAQQHAGDPDGNPGQRRVFDDSRRNFLALVFCLMLGTAGLPHVLMRSYTTPSVNAARESVAWSLLFIVLLYLSAPALAVMLKFEILGSLVGTPFDQLPAWIANWSRIDPALVSVTDINRDGVLQLAELRISGDLIMLATPEIAGLPYVVSGMVAAGGLAAALSTADGLLLTISYALSHDLYYKVLQRDASTIRRVTVSKVLLLVVALCAAAVAAQKPADILFLVTAAFSIAASALFPALVLGIFWARANRIGGVFGMLAGLGVTLTYMVRNDPWLRSVFGIDAPIELWFGILPVSAGVFGVSAGVLAIVVGSLLTAAPDAPTRALVERLRLP